MANANAVKLRDRKNYAAPTAANLAHNSAMTKAAYWLNAGDKIIQSHSYENHAQLNEDFQKWENEAKEKYARAHTNKMRNDVAKVEELLLVIGTDVKVDDESVLKIIEDFKKKFEEEHKTEILHWAFHNHEGHINEAGEEELNKHVHMLFSDVNEDGMKVRKNWKKEQFSKFQDDIYEISKKYVPEIERGARSEYKTVEIAGRKVQLNTKKGKSHHTYRAEKQKEELARQVDLKAEVNLLRKELQEAKANREDYAKLEALTRDLKEQIQNKDLTIEQLQTTLKNYKENNMETEKIKELEEKLEKKSEENKENFQTAFKAAKERSKYKSELEELELKFKKNELQRKSLQDTLKELASIFDTEDNTEAIKRAYRAKLQEREDEVLKEKERADKLEALLAVKRHQENTEKIEEPEKEKEKTALSSPEREREDRANLDHPSKPKKEGNQLINLMIEKSMKKSGQIVKEVVLDSIKESAMNISHPLSEYAMPAFLKDFDKMEESELAMFYNYYKKEKFDEKMHFTSFLDTCKTIYDKTDSKSQFETMFNQQKEYIKSMPSLEVQLERKLNTKQDPNQGQELGLK